MKIIGDDGDNHIYCKILLQKIGLQIGDVS
jgi:hypothetical protein